MFYIFHGRNVYIIMKLFIRWKLETDKNYDEIYKNPFLLVRKHQICRYQVSVYWLIYIASALDIQQAVESYAQVYAYEIISIKQSEHNGKVV